MKNIERFEVQFGSKGPEIHPAGDAGGYVVIADVNPDKMFTPEHAETIAYQMAAAPELLKFTQHFFEWHANNFGDFNDKVNGELLCLANEIEPILKQQGV